MNLDLSRISKPRCILLYALAPAGRPAAEANASDVVPVLLDRAYRRAVS